MNQMNQDQIDDLFKTATILNRVFVNQGTYRLVGNPPVKYPEEVTAIQLVKPTPLVPRAKAGDWLCIDTNGSFGILTNDDICFYYKRF